MDETRILYLMISGGIILIGILILLKLMIEKKGAKMIYAKVVDKKIIKGSMNYLNGDRSLTYHYPIVLVVEDKKNLGIFELKKAKQSTEYEMDTEVAIYKINGRFEEFVIKSVKGYYSTPSRVIVLGIVLTLLVLFI